MNLRKLFGPTVRTVVTDGAWGTELQADGLPAGTCPDAWNLENPQAVSAVATSYVRAGSQVILTNTFRSNRFALSHWGLAGKASEIAEAGAAISRRAAGTDAKVFGSMGPSGKLVIMGDVREEELLAIFAEQASALARGGADAIVCETFSELQEALLAARAVRENTNLPVIISMTFDSGPDKTATMMGTRPADLARAAAGLKLAAVGANCGAGPEHFAAIARLFRSASPLPIWIKPNAGLPVVRDGRTTFPLGPKEFAEHVPALIEAGAAFIGGCCGTTPDHIRAIRDTIARG